MNFNKLRYIITVAEEKSITQAAKKLYISQPSLSQCIQSIEARLGVELFVRKKSCVSLTEAGEIYLEWAKATLESEAQMIQRLEDYKAGALRSLSVGCTWQRSAILMPGAILNFYSEVAGCTVRVTEDSNARLQEALAQRELDMIVGVPHPDTSQFVSVPLFHERFLLAAHKSKPIPCTPGRPYPHVNREVLKDHPLILLTENQYLGKFSRKVLNEIGYTPQNATICYSLETVHQFVSKNIGISLLPEVSIASKTYEDVSYYFFDDDSMGRMVALVYRADNPQIRDIRKFSACMKESIRNLDYPFLMS